MSSLSRELAELFRRDLTRLHQQVEATPDDATLWRTLPGTTNSIGNLALHLEGNLREFVGRQLGGVPYQRVRPAEFGTKDLSQDDLLTRIEALVATVPPIIEGLRADALDATFPEAVLGRPISSRQFLIHLSGHLNYHLGQIDYLRRIATESGAIALAGI